MDRSRELERSAPPGDFNHGHLINRDLQQQDDFNDLVDRSNQVLITVRSVFPFDLFPDEVSVDYYKVNILTNEFLTQRKHSVLIKDIRDIYVNKSILFSSLNIVDWGFSNPDKSIVINNLKKDDADEALKIIQGLMVSARANIDVAKITRRDFKNKIEQLGETKGVSSVN